MFRVLPRAMCWSTASALALAACSTGPSAPLGQSSSASVHATTVALSASSVDQSGVPLGHFDGLPSGQPGCSPPSPVVWPEVRGTATSVSLWGLIQTTGSQVRAGQEVKIVWRMTGSGDLRATATGPSGQPIKTAWGPDPHASSNYNRPGDEWGVGYLFTDPGCWHLRLSRGTAVGDVWLQVAS
jgi:hypothetical protein